MFTALETLRGLRSGAISIPSPLNDSIDVIDRIELSPVADEILTALRAELTRLHEYIIRLRTSDPPKGTRQQAVSYQNAQIEKLVGRSMSIGGTENGWPDPADVFADGDQIIGLREGLAELTAEGNPYPVPLPDGCVLLPQANFDPFEYGRLYNGMIIKTV